LHSNISLLYCETQVTIISTITGNKNNSRLRETFHLNGTQSLEGSEDRCVQVTPWQQASDKHPFCRQSREMLGQQNPAASLWKQGQDRVPRRTPGK